jgi:hypothetical protein
MRERGEGDAHSLSNRNNHEEGDDDGLAPGVGSRVVGGHVDGGVGVGEGNAGEVPVGEEPAELSREEEGEKEAKEGQR